LTVGAALIGATGMWGARIADAAARTSSLRVLTCFARDAEQTRAFAEARGIRAVSSLEEAITGAGVEVALLVTPNDVHAEQAIVCADHGTHVFVEKPIASTVADAERMRDDLLRIERDPDRHALHHLDPVAGRVLRRQQRERRAGACAEAFDGAVVRHLLAVDVGLELDRLADAQVPELAFLEVGVDPDVVERDHRQQRRARLDALAEIVFLAVAATEGLVEWAVSVPRVAPHAHAEADGRGRGYRREPGRALAHQGRHGVRREARG